MGEPQELELPTPGQPIEIPGLATITVGRPKKTVNDHAGTAIADALRVHLIPTDTVVTVGHTSAQVLAGVKHGTFRGSSAATQMSALDGTITSGRNPLSLMPCQGTDGKELVPRRSPASTPAARSSSRACAAPSAAPSSRTGASRWSAARSPG